MTVSTFFATSLAWRNCSFYPSPLDAPLSTSIETWWAFICKLACSTPKMKRNDFHARMCKNNESKLAYCSSSDLNSLTFTRALRRFVNVLLSRISRYKLVLQKNSAYSKLMDSMCLTSDSSRRYDQLQSWPYHVLDWNFKQVVDYWLKSRVFVFFLRIANIMY